jgi:CheY-like chemotaxis protein
MDKRDTAADCKCILLVEDEVLVRMLAIEYLQEAGYEVEAAASAAEAIAKASQSARAIDAAVIDLGLPDARGDGLVRELRALHAALPIIIASGYGAADLPNSLKQDGLSGCVGKPYTPEQLIGGVRKLLQA